MKKSILYGIITMLLFAGATQSFADPVKGQKIFLKKVKKSCGVNGAKIAAMHTQDEWEVIKDQKNGIKNELEKICPKLKDSKKIKPAYYDELFDFFYEYAKDSGNVPSC